MILTTDILKRLHGSIKEKEFLIGQELINFCENNLPKLPWPTLDQILMFDPIEEGYAGIFSCLCPKDKTKGFEFAQRIYRLYSFFDGFCPVIDLENGIENVARIIRLSYGDSPSVLIPHSCTTQLILHATNKSSLITLRANELGSIGYIKEASIYDYFSLWYYTWPIKLDEGYSLERFWHSQSNYILKSLDLWLEIGEFSYNEIETDLALLKSFIDSYANFDFKKMEPDQTFELIKNYKI